MNIFKVKINETKFKPFWIIYLWLVLVAAVENARTPRQNEYCVGHKHGEFVPNPMDCQLFYWCGENEESVLASCPRQMLFNPLTKLCDNFENVSCESGLTTSTKKPIPTTIEPTPTKAPSWNVQYCYNHSNYALVFLPHPRNCQQYLMCYNGEVLLQTCSSKLHWNTKLGKCDLPSNAECLPSELEEDEDEHLGILTSLNEPIGENGIKCPLYIEHIFPNVKRCDSFIYCVKGQAVFQSCPFYQHFDVESARCIVRFRATCVKDLIFTQSFK